MVEVWTFTAVINDGKDSDSKLSGVTWSLRKQPGARRTAYRRTSGRDTNPVQRVVESYLARFRIRILDPEWLYVLRA